MGLTTQGVTGAGDRPEFVWGLHPDAEAVADEALAAALRASPRLAAWADGLLATTSTRLVDWVDHVAGPLDTAAAAAAGYVLDDATGLWRHPGAQLPALAESPGRHVVVRVGDAEAFAGAAGVPGGRVDGAPLGTYRLAPAWEDGGVTFAGAERRSWAAGTRPDEATPDVTARRRAARDAWLRRPVVTSPRPGGRGDDTAEVMAATVAAAAALADAVGPDLAAGYAMEAERDRWEARNHAGRTQRARQDRLGLGWGNHDHHTFRSSRVHFAALVAALAELGFACREQFYAGREAGWGAQVMEQRGAGLVVFADVDLTDDEVDVDFAHAGLPPADRLGTVGLWCALHGESLLDAGMHHLEGQFQFDALRADLAAEGIAHLTPFSDMPHLRQAFTAAEVWPVAPWRLDALVAAGLLDAEAADRFRAEGAAGSHLENLARRAGFKGFNQRNVSRTIRDTDPRRYRPAAG
jgi:hypothetical protein